MKRRGGMWLWPVYAICLAVASMFIASVWSDPAHATAHKWAMTATITLAFVGLAVVVYVTERGTR